MVTDLQMRFPLVRSLMVHVAIIVISICGIFIRLRPTR